MTKAIGCFLDALIGDVVDLDVGASGDCCGKYIRVRVVVDITKPLKRFLKVKLLNGDAPAAMLIKHERLPEFCLHCCYLGHSVLECVESRGTGQGAMEHNYKFGVWLRASSPRRNVARGS
ncbi:hypothetical protein ACOSQ3_018661 [Xanthoceras sorbifolium]